MDENHHQSPRLTTLKQFIRSHHKTTKFLLSVSVFSLFFSHSTLHSNFSALPLKLFTRTIDKNLMFLFCNGLLVLLAKYSRLRNPPPKHSLNNDYYLKGYEDITQMRPRLSLVDERTVERNGETGEDRKNEVLVQQLEPEKLRVPEVEAQEGRGVGGEEEANNHETLTEGGGEEEDEVHGDEHEEAEEEEVGEGNVALLSTEELNKKFDEFIRKMKEELRIEARQQLIMV